MDIITWNQIRKEKVKNLKGSINFGIMPSARLRITQLSQCLMKLFIIYGIFYV